MPRLFATHLPRFHHDFAYCMVDSDLYELAFSQQITSAVADVHDEGSRPDDVNHRQCRAHALPLGMCGNNFVNTFLARLKRLLQMVLEVVLGVLFETKAPRKTVKYVGRQLVDCNGAGSLALRFTAHAIGDDQ